MQIIYFKINNFFINNLDITIICEKPKIISYKKMKDKIASLLKINVELINIKVMTTEKLGFLGKRRRYCLSIDDNCFKEK